MKKFITVLLILALSLSLTVFAEDENFLKNEKWTQGHSSGIKNVDGVWVATGISGAYKSPVINILPALEKALGDEDEITVVISFEARMVFKEGTADKTSGGRLIARGANGTEFSTKTEASDWREAYSEALDGEKSLFYLDPDGNILYSLAEGSVKLTDEWTLVQAPLTLMATQIKNGVVTQWNMCFDGIRNTSAIEALEIRNTSLIISDEPIETPTPEPTATPKATPKPQTGADKNDNTNADADQGGIILLQTPDLSGTVLENGGIVSAPQSNGNSAPNVTTTVIVGVASGVLGIVIGFVASTLIKGKKKETE